MRTIRTGLLTNCIMALALCGCVTTQSSDTGKEDYERERALGAATLESNRATAQCPLERASSLPFEKKQAELVEVYRKLSYFMSSSRRRAPKLIVRAGGKQVPPYYLPDSNRIVVGEKLHDICATFGSKRRGCLAFFLGHELTHFTRGHMQSWDAFVAGSGEKTRAVAKHSNQQSEAQADEEGGFFSYLAGFDSLSVSEQSLLAMYSCYGLKKNLSGYLPLDGRRKVLRRATKRVAKLGLAFDAANHAMMIGRHDLAAVLFDHVTDRFASPETLNGAASARLMYAQRLIETSGGKAYAYPLTMDLSSRVKSWKKKRRRKGPKARGLEFAREQGGETKTSKEEKEDKKKDFSSDERTPVGMAMGMGMAEDAPTDDPSDGFDEGTVEGVDDDDIHTPGAPTEVETSIEAAMTPEHEEEPEPLDPKILMHVEDAIELLVDVIEHHEPDYLPALINLACAELMRGDQETAFEYIERALEIARRDDARVAEDDLRVLRAILYDASGHQEAALLELEETAASRAEFARKTRDAITGEDTSPQVDAEGIETIHGYEITDKLRISKPDLLVELGAEMLGKKLLTVEKKTTKLGSAIEISLDRRPMFFFVTVPKGYQGKSLLGIELGSSAETIFERYGAPEVSLSTASGKALYGFQDPDVIFEVDGSNTVSSWTAYYDKMD